MVEIDGPAIQESILIPMQGQKSLDRWMSASSQNNAAARASQSGRYSGSQRIEVSSCMAENQIHRPSLLSRVSLKGLDSLSAPIYPEASIQGLELAAAVFSRTPISDSVLLRMSLGWLTFQAATVHCCV